MLGGPKRKYVCTCGLTERLTSTRPKMQFDLARAGEGATDACAKVSGRAEYEHALVSCGSA